MIKSMAVANFKSIKKIRMDCNRINLFFGPPNSGKTNIMEALGLFSWRGQGSHQASNLPDYIRFHTLHDIFCDGRPNERIEILAKTNDNYSMEIHYNSDLFQVKCKINNTPVMMNKGQSAVFLNPAGEVVNQFAPFVRFAFMKYYKFLKQETFQTGFSSFLYPPFGTNLFTLVLGNKEAGALVTEFFKGFGLNILVKSPEKTFQVLRSSEELSTAFPYRCLSDTLQRLLCFNLAAETNEESTLVFEESDTQSYPYYTENLAETLARNNSNQYFLSLQSPAFLKALVEKNGPENVNVFLVYPLDKYTKVKQLTDRNITRIMETGVFPEPEALLESQLPPMVILQKEVSGAKGQDSPKEPEEEQ